MRLLRGVLAASAVAVFVLAVTACGGYGDDKGEEGGSTTIGGMTAELHGTKDVSGETGKVEIELYDDYFEPTILTGVTPDSVIAQEEVFGPVLAVLPYRDDDDAVAIANNSQYGLSGAVWGNDVDRAVNVARRVRTGQIAVNGCIPGDAPFGGFKQSGLGREGGGLPGLYSYMEQKAIGIPA